MLISFHVHIFLLALTRYYFALPPVSGSFFNLGAFINEFVGTEAHKPVWMGA